MAEAVDLPQLVLRRAVMRRGADDDDIARLRRSGAWTTLQHGAHLVGGRRLDDRTRHLLAVRATVAALRTPAEQPVRWAAGFRRRLRRAA